MAPDIWNRRRAWTIWEICTQLRVSIRKPKPSIGNRLAIREKALKPDDPQLAISLHNLAQLYFRLGQYTEAETLHRRALLIRTRALAETDPAVIMSLTDLARVYREEGRFREAESLSRQAINPSREDRREPNIRILLRC